MKSRHFFFEDGAYGQGESDVGSPGPREMLVKTTKSLVSVGTETKCNNGKIPWKKGWHGYSSVGRVVEVGADVSEFAPGQRIFGFRPHVDYYLGNLDAPWFTAYPVPDDLSDADATFATLSTVALHIVERASVALGQTVVVMGQGTVGLLVSQLARLAGAGCVVGVDPDASRHGLAREVGVDATIVPDLTLLSEVLSTERPNAPAPILIEVCGVSEVVNWMTEAAPVGSRLVLTGTFERSIDYPIVSIVEKELSILGAHQPKDLETPHPYYPYNRPYNITLTMDLIRGGRLLVSQLVSDTISPDDLVPFYDAVRDGKPHTHQPLVDWEPNP